MHVLTILTMMPLFSSDRSGAYVVLDPDGSPGVGLRRASAYHLLEDGKESLNKPSFPTFQPIMRK